MTKSHKKIVEALRGQNIMTGLGEKAIEAAKQNGAWDAPKADPITEEAVAVFAKKLAGLSPAYENFMKMPPSVQSTYTRRYLSFKSEEARQRDFEKIVERLHKNLKPM